MSTAIPIQKNIHKKKVKRSKHQYRHQRIEVAAERTVNHRLFSVGKIVKIDPIRIKIILVKTVQPEIRKKITILVLLAERVASIDSEKIHGHQNREQIVEDTVEKIVRNVGVLIKNWSHKLIGV